MEKKNTILLTVIAVATLLVAVVGASFAFFAVQETNNANVDITTTTAKANDVFSATGSGALSLAVTNDVMQKAATLGESGQPENNLVAVSAEDNNMKVSLTAGSGKASCSYKITYTNTGAEYKMTADAANGKEYTIAGTDGTQTIAETNMDKVTSFGPFTIEDTYEEASAATVQTWTFTAKFYNLAANQNDHLNKTYSGTFKVTDVVCTNASTTPAE